MNIKRFISIMLCLLLAFGNISYVSFAQDFRETFEWVSPDTYNNKKTANSQFTASLNDNGDTYVEYIGRGDWLGFSNFNFDDSPEFIELSIAAGVGYDGVMDVRLDSSTGPLIASISFIGESWYYGTKYTAELTEHLSGKHDIYICWKTQSCNFFGFRFINGAEGSESSDYIDVQGTKYEKNLTLLNQLGIVPKSSSEYFGINVPVNRGEFASVIKNIYGANEYKASGTSPFTDVLPEDDYYDALSFLYDNKIVSGNGNGLYYPKSFITPNEAVIIACRVLGYGDFENLGSNYVRIASNLKLLNGVEVSDNALKRGEMLNLVKNIIEAKYLSLESYKTSDDGSVSEKYAKIPGILSSTRGIYKTTGIIDSNSNSGIYTPGSSLKSGSVTVNGIRFAVEKVSFEKYLGYNCECYYTDTNGNKTIVALAPADVVETIVIDTNSDMCLDKLTTKGVTYWDKNNKERNVKFEKDAAIIYNGVALDFDLENYLKNKEFSGKITCVNNGNGYDTVIIERYSNIVISNVDANNQVITDGITGEEFNLKDGNLKIVSEGIYVEFDSVNAGMSGVIYASNNSHGPKVAELVLIDDYIKGSVSSIYDNTVIITDTQYKVSSELKKSMYVGLEAKFYINPYGEIISFVTGLSDDVNIGCLMGYGPKGALNSYLEIKVYTKDGDLKVLDCVSDLVFEGKKETNAKAISDVMNSNLILPVPVMYKLNSEGKVTMLDTPHSIAKNSNDSITPLSITSTQYYVKANKLILDSSGRSAYPVSDVCSLFSISDAEDMERSFAMDLTDYKRKETRIKWDLYSISPDSEFVSIAVEKDVSATGDWGSCMIFNDIRDIYDPSAGVIKTYITGYSGANFVSYELDSALFTEEKRVDLAKLRALEKGDYIQPYLADNILTRADYQYINSADNSRKYMDGSEEKTFKSNYNSNSPAGGSYNQDYRFTVGTVTEFSQENPDFIKIRLANNSNDEYVNVSKAAIVTVNNEGGKTVIETGQPKNAISVGDTVVVWIYYKTIRHVVVYK